MRIDPNVPIPNSGTTERIADAPSTGAARSPRRAGATGDETEVAGASASISALATQLGNFPSVRQERVQALRQAVRSGNYHVDAAQVAQSMLGDLYGTGSRS